MQFEDSEIPHNPALPKLPQHFNLNTFTIIMGPKIY